jgi:plasmid stabilization system protein ParE
MKRFRLTRQAARDLREIYDYIAADSARAARNVRIQLFEACQLLAEHTELGRYRPELTNRPYRFWSVLTYLIVYDSRVRPVRIGRVLHGKRDVTPLLG